MKKVRLAAMLMCVIMVLSVCQFGEIRDNCVKAEGNKSEELMVFGNKVVLKNTPQRVIRLSGVNVPGGEWTGTPSVEKLDRSTIYAIDNWNCNIIRLAVDVNGWTGNYSYVKDGGNSYRNYIDSVIKIVSEKGAYVVLDLHHYTSFNNSKYLAFWKEAAVKYANNPTVLFGILNEPHSISWDVWRNGNGSNVTGHQQVVELIRDLGARNIIVAGGLDWGYDLSGIAKGYALVDQGSGNNKALSGNGIIYDTHIYPWKGTSSNWNNKVGAVRKQHPILIGECGWDADLLKSLGNKNPKPGDPLYHDKWCPELLAWIDDVETFGNYANYTAYCMHPRSTPSLVVDDGNWKDDDKYKYPLTSHWGVYLVPFITENLSTRYTALGTPHKIAIRDPRLYYQVGDKFDIQNGVIMAYDELGNYYEVPFSDKEASFSGFDSSKAVQSQKITVSYMGASAQYEINISESMLMGGKNPSDIEKRYLSIDFEDAAADSEDSVRFNMTNKADGSPYSVKTYQTISGTRSAYRIMTTSTACLRAPAKAAAPYDFIMPSAVTKEDGRVYVDMRLYRASATADDPVTLSLVDSSGNKIFTLKYIVNEAPVLIASNEYSSSGNYPVESGWRHIRAIINFDMKTFELYQGESFDSLDNFIAGTNMFAFENTAASDLYRISNYNVDGAEYGGALGFDDIDVYTVATAPKYVWPVTGIEIKDPIVNYQTYDELNTSVGIILVSYANGIIKEVPLSEDGVVISGFDSMIDGAQTITVRYLGFTAVYDVYVAHYTYMTGIRAEGLKDTYSLNETFDRTQGYVYLEYADGTAEELPFSNAGINISGFSTSTTGSKTLTISYGAFKTTFVITVVPDITSITVTGLKDSYSADEPIDFEKAVINILYIDGTTGTHRLDSDDVTIIKRASSSTNKVTIAITYKNKRYTHTAALVDSIYDWQITIGTLTKSERNISASASFKGGSNGGDMIVFAKDARGRVISVAVYPIAAGTDSCDIFLTSDCDMTNAKVYCVMWDNAKTMIPVSYLVTAK